MKLTDLDPRWGVTRESRGADGVWFYNVDRVGMGITFDCPCCRTTRLAIFFSNPIDGKAPASGSSHDLTIEQKLWKRTGESFETLTIDPSIDASKAGHWHGHVQNGEIVGGI